MDQFNIETQLKALVGSFLILLDATAEAMRKHEPEMARKVERLTELGMCEVEGRIEFHPVPALVISMRLEGGALIEVARLNVPPVEEAHARLEIH